uniref:C-src tyrosine kinase n=2 Tax=Tetraselmis sp. GSL018 TaxID=582737 RepID=A0A061R3F0_9CHLO|eukprot:CAMPEP_0177605856 /NCGR_PEP_ID=MMETSP0419_2-20121207/16946_1 /TAXON_ID=582737 /ORGANISM="Tetraselmis sp., Strain GSL018" /LENGTH=556 /DNA_ID=CAMNT_0019100077 /DNA_START=396 /DNA_END=2066 /DNA_ORIENTATION=+
MRLSLHEATEWLRCNEPTLTELSLDESGIGAEGAKELAKALRQSSKLKQLNLRKNAFGAEGAKALAEALKHNSVLTRLSLGDNGIGAEGAAAIAEALRHNGALTVLSLQHNGIGAEGAEMMAKALRHNGALKQIHLIKNGIGDEGASALAETLRHNSSITDLGLQWNRIGDKGAKVLAKALQHNRSLKELYLGKNTVGEEGVKALAEALRHNSTLTKLNLRSNKVGADGCIALKEALRHNSALTELCLDSNGISEELLQELETALSAEGPGQQVSPPHTVPSSRIEEIPFSELQLGPVIGTGSSKTIHHSQWRGQDVAILVLHSRDAAAELAVFERLTRRPGLTCLFGVSRDSKGRQMLVTEFAPMGSLNKVLADLEDDGRSASDLVLMKCAMQVCEGMMQLVEEGLIHRDLALRNVLVFGFSPENYRAVHVKVTDYGLTQEGLCYYGGSEAVPIRWMPPEALKRRKWSEKSDIWAFGVLMWELWSAAEVPFAFVSSDEEVARIVTRGQRLEKPEGCPDCVFALMQRCWEGQAECRPSFQELQTELLSLYVELAVS